MTIIVPLDFSAQSIKAASFATHMLHGIYEAELVFYHLYHDEKEEESVIQNLEKIKHGLAEISSVSMRYIAEKGSGLIESIKRLINREDAELVVMTVSDRIKVFENSYSLQMMAHTDCPVLVIPNGYLYNGVRSVALATDFINVEKTIPVAKVKNILNIFHPQLHIVHVNPEIYVSLSEDLLAERNKMEEMFKEFRPEFYFITTENFTESLERFIEDKGIDLVLTFPKKHSYLTTLIKGTNTQKLVYKNSVPVLAAHE